MRHFLVDEAGYTLPLTVQQQLYWLCPCLFCPAVAGRVVLEHQLSWMGQ